jgi:hypothetical protein
MDEFARVINGAKDDFATVLHDIGELREKFAQVNARFQKFTGTADENFSTLHGLVDDYRSRLNKVTSKLHILQQSHNWLSDRVLVLENDTVRKLTDRVKGWRSCRRRSGESGCRHSSSGFGGSPERSGRGDRNSSGQGLSMQEAGRGGRCGRSSRESRIFMLMRLKVRGELPPSI